MPSKAFEKFEKFMLKDVNSLISLHNSISNKSMGKKGLGHVTRSGILMLCSAWELYVEELLVEATTYLTKKSTDPSSLPKQVQKTLARYLKSHKNELKVLELAGDGWRNCLNSRALDIASYWNTPNEENINSYFYKFIGLKELSSHWTSQDINKFIKIRGKIAHHGSQAKYVRLLALTSYLKIIKDTAIEIDNKVGTHLRDITPTNRMPWRRRT